ncbi:hypothetical protein EGI15_12985 [Chryseobacterium cucumeris]|uniref:Transposase n=1 Tax=Chryseobacterium cucumeris TaxID=1813611 RepID=A0ABX9X781_9FLAO|nr:hypothetical protein EGI15_12985 [Chryseobacterium cucumeris]
MFGKGSEKNKHKIHSGLIKPVKHFRISYQRKIFRDLNKQQKLFELLKSEIRAAKKTYPNRQVFNIFLGIKDL